MTDLLNALVLLANFLFIPALSYGSQLALGALGVTLIFGILRFANFAHGRFNGFWYNDCNFINVVTSILWNNFGFLPTALLALPFAIIITIIFSLLVDRYVFRFYRIKKSPPVTSCNGFNWSNVYYECYCANYHRSKR